MKITSARGKIVSATVVHKNARELIQPFVVAMQHNIGLTELVGAHTPHPGFFGELKKIQVLAQESNSNKLCDWFKKVLKKK